MQNSLQNRRSRNENGKMWKQSNNTESICNVTVCSVINNEVEKTPGQRSQWEIFLKIWWINKKSTVNTSRLLI